MYFISFPFFVFFLVLLIIYYTFPKQMQVIILLSAGLLFYGWADFRFLFYILLTGSSIFAAAGVLGKINEAKQILSKRLTTFSGAAKPPAQRRMQLVQKQMRLVNRMRYLFFLAPLLFNLGILALTKYTNFAVSTINRISGSHLSFVSVLVPMGISFYTFQAVGYLIDVYRGTITPEKSLVRFLLFTSFFPQLIQGPISRYADLSETLYTPHTFTLRHVLRGCERILWGIFKKMVIADRLRPFVDSVFSGGSEFSGVTVFTGMVFFVLMLYTDFSGGIDMTIGISESLGIMVTDNFKQPFFSKSLKEYWRRWHITMGSWFRDYVFYPISMSAGMRRLIQWNKKYLGKTAARKVPVYIATFITWFATGLWHGAGWNYVCWGLANACILMLSEELEPVYVKIRKALKTEASRLFRVFQSVRTFILIGVLNLFDCAGSLQGALAAFFSMFVKLRPGVLTDGSLLSRGMGVGDFVVVAISLMILFLADLYSYRAAEQDAMPDLRNRIRKLPLPAVVLIYYCLFLMVLVFGVYGRGYEQAQFIYNRF